MRIILILLATTLIFSACGKKENKSSSSTPSTTVAPTVLPTSSWKYTEAAPCTNYFGHNNTGCITSSTVDSSAKTFTVRFSTTSGLFGETLSGSFTSNTPVVFDENTTASKYAVKVLINISVNPPILQMNYDMTTSSFDNSLTRNYTLIAQ